MHKSSKLELTEKIEPGYKKARIRIDNKIKLVVAQLYVLYGFNEFVYSSIKLSQKCGTRDYATSVKDHYIMQTYRGNNLSRKMSTYRLRQDRFTGDVKQIAISLLEKPVTLRELPTTYDKMHYVIFNLNNIVQAGKSVTLNNADKFKMKQLERALLLYGVQEDPKDSNLITLGIPHKQVGCRLYSTWPFCIQNTSSDLRHLVIHGDSVDLNAAAVQCMVELAIRHNGNQTHIDALQYYVNHKQDIRKKLSEEFNVLEDDIKRIFNILVIGGNGSSAQVNANFKDSNSIAMTIGDKQVASRIVENEFVKSFYAAVKALRVLITEAKIEVIENGWQITNDAGLTQTWVKKENTKKHIKPRAKMMNWLYLGWELTTMSDNTEFMHGRGLPMHDSREGVTALEKLCNSLDNNNIQYEAESSSVSNHFIFPDIQTLIDKDISNKRKLLSFNHESI